MLKLVLLILPFVFILMAVLNFQNAGTGRVSRGTKIKLILIGILVTLLVTAISLALSLGVNYFSSNDYASAGITFNYAEASNGLNPDKTRFNPSSIISDDVLEAAISYGNFGNVTPQDLKNCLSVTSPLGGVMYSSEDDYKIVTHYTLSFNKNSATRHLDPKMVVNTIADVFSEQYVQKYSDNYSVLTIDDSQIGEVDYLDAVLLLNKEAERLRQYMMSCSGENWGFVSSDGQSFSTIAEKITNFQDVQLEKLNSYILTHGVSKNSSQYISRLKYDNNLLNVMYQKNVSSYNIRLDAINIYDEALARIVLVPTEDQDGEFYMSQTQIGVDYFADDADRFMGEFAKIQLETDTNNLKINRFTEATGDSLHYQTVENLLTSLKKDLNDLASSTIAIAQDYSQKKASTYVTIEKPKTGLSTRLNFKTSAIYAGICALITIIWVISLGKRSAGKQSKKEEVAEE